MASKSWDTLLRRAGFKTIESLSSYCGVDRRTLWRWRKRGAPKRKSLWLAIVADSLRTTEKTLRVALAPSQKRR